LRIPQLQVAAARNPKLPLTTDSSHLSEPTTAW